MLIRIVKSWGYPADFLKQTPMATGEWSGTKFTEEPVEECDALIVLQNPSEDIKVKCPIGNKWLISQEPPVKAYKFCIKSYKYFDRVYSYYNHNKHPFIQTLQPVLPWHLNKSYDELIRFNRGDLTNKANQLTWITSNKSWFVGHKKRMQFKDYLLNADIKFNLLGKGFDPIQDKFEGLFPVKYALAIENFQQNNYWTEKLADCYLSWCLPFYWGAENLENYFPKESFIRIDINDFASALATIQNAIQNKEWEKRLDAIEEARNLVLNHYQFFPYISRMLREAGNLSNEKRTAHIPANKLPRLNYLKGQIKYYSNRIYKEFLSTK